MENEAQGDRNDAPPRKRLLTDPNPMASFVTASPESTVSSDSSSDRFEKKTRELPNLSDCHSCGVRINYTNPRERLQPLDSMWRVVLLCRKCSKRVKSSDLCPYCFSAVVDATDCFKCIDCHHSIHKDCVAKYGSGLGFSVCVDCWVPEAVVKSIRVRKRKSRKRNKEACEPVATLPESTGLSKVSVPETSRPNFLGEEVERKVAAAAIASENALRKAVVAKNAIELAKGVLNAVASTSVTGNCETKVAGDTELAFMLHRAINSSPRISRYACLTSSFRMEDEPIMCYSRRRRKGGLWKTSSMHSSNLDVPLMCYARRRRKGGLMSSTTLDAPLVCYSRKRGGSKACMNVTKCERIDKCVSICSFGLTASDSGVMETRTVDNAECSLNGNEHQENEVGECMEPDRYLLKYHRVGKGIPRSSVLVKTSDCGSCMDSSNLYTEAMSNMINFGYGDKSCAMGEEKCSNNPDRFLLKYKKGSTG